jgi:hypothetical protein
MMRWYALLLCLVTPSFPAGVQLLLLACIICIRLLLGLVFAFWYVLFGDEWKLLEVAGLIPDLVAVEE